MSVTLNDIEIRALQLSHAERTALIQNLIHSLEGESETAQNEIVAAWGKEITRRMIELDAGHSGWLSRLR